MREHRRIHRIAFGRARGKAEGADRAGEPEFRQADVVVAKEQGFGGRIAKQGQRGGPSLPNRRRGCKGSAHDHAADEEDVDDQISRDARFGGDRSRRIAQVPRNPPILRGVEDRPLGGEDHPDPKSPEEHHTLPSGSEGTRQGGRLRGNRAGLPEHDAGHVRAHQDRPHT